jgi:hypothetical protein
MMPVQMSGVLSRGGRSGSLQHLLGGRHYPRCGITRQRPQRPHHTPDTSHRHGPTGLAHRTRSSTRRSALPDQPGHPDERRRAHPTSRSPYRRRADHLPDPDRQDGHTARAATHRGDATAPRRGRHHRHRVWLGHENVTTTQIYLNERPRAQTTGTRPDHPTGRQPRPLPATRPPAGIPGRSLIMPIPRARTRSPAAPLATVST